MLPGKPPPPTPHSTPGAHASPAILRRPSRGGGRRAGATPHQRRGIREINRHHPLAGMSLLQAPDRRQTRTQDRRPRGSRRNPHPPTPRRRDSPRPKRSPPRRGPPPTDLRTRNGSAPPPPHRAPTRARPPASPPARPAAGERAPLSSAPAHMLQHMKVILCSTASK